MSSSLPLLLKCVMTSKCHSQIRQRLLLAPSVHNPFEQMDLSRVNGPIPQWIKGYFERRHNFFHGIEYATSFKRRSITSCERMASAPLRQIRQEAQKMFKSCFETFTTDLTLVHCII